MKIRDVAFEAVFYTTAFLISKRPIHFDSFLTSIIRLAVEADGRNPSERE